MPKLDVIDTFVEDIAKVCTEVGVHPRIRDLLIKMHEDNRTLQEAVNGMNEQFGQVLQAIRLSQELHKHHTAAVNKIIGRANGNVDPDMLRAVDIKEQS